MTLTGSEVASSSAMARAETASDCAHTQPKAEARPALRNTRRYRFPCKARMSAGPRGGWRPMGAANFDLGAVREQELRQPVGRSARARVADSVSRWLDWTEANRTIWLATIARGEDIADPDVRRVVADLVRRAVALVAAHHADIAQDSPRLRYALACWTGLNRAATRRWLRGEASREATHELLASTLEHVLRTFGTSPTPNRRTTPR